MRLHFLPLALALHTRMIAAQCPLTSSGFVAPPQQALDGVRTTFFDLPPDYGFPIGITYGRDSNEAFVTFGTNSTTVNIPHDTYLVVLNTSDFSPTITNAIQYPNASTGPQGAPGIAMSHDGQLIYAAAGYGAFVVDRNRAANRQTDALVGYLNGSTSTSFGGDDGFGVLVSNDDDYIFVLQEQISTAGFGGVGVFKMSQSSVDGNATGTFVGFLELSIGVTNAALSSDDRYLYVGSESAGIRADHKSLLPGVINVLDVAALKQNNGSAVLANVTADCGNTRSLLSQDGKILWVANRGNNTVVAFDTTKMLSDPENARLVSLSVGTAPDGLALVKNDSLLLVANTNRFHDKYSPAYLPNATAGISVVDVQAALQHRSWANLGQIPAGDFPRDMAVAPDGRRVLVSNTDSLQIMVIDVETLPGGLARAEKGMSVGAWIANIMLWTHRPAADS